MGVFVAAAAFRTDNADAVLDAVRCFFREQRWPAQPVETQAAEAGEDVFVHPPASGWTVVLWPRYFTDIPAVRFVSAALSVAASAVRIHDGDYWAHLLVDRGRVLDRFASMPDYFTDDPDEVARLITRWAGNAAALAEVFSRSEAHIAPYLVHVRLDDLDEQADDLQDAEACSGKALPDDAYDRDDPWVFTDFWRRVGITYPADASTAVHGLRLAPGWLGKLPTGDEEL